MYNRQYFSFSDVIFSALLLKKTESSGSVFFSAKKF